MVKSKNVQELFFEQIREEKIGTGHLFLSEGVIKLLSGMIRNANFGYTEAKKTIANPIVHTFINYYGR